MPEAQLLALENELEAYLKKAAPSPLPIHPTSTPKPPHMHTVLPPCSSSSVHKPKKHTRVLPLLCGRGALPSCWAGWGGFFFFLALADLSMDRLSCQVRTARIDARREAAAASTDCVICMEEPRCMLLLPCAHLCLCESCAAQCKTCPICRDEVAEHKKTFSS